MSNFSASIKAILDTSGIQGQIKNIESSATVKIKRFSLDTKSLPSQIQASLDGHKFKISLDGIKTTNIDSQMKGVGQKAGQTLVNSINSKLNSGGIEAAIAKVNAQYEKLGTSGHASLTKIKQDIDTLRKLHNSMSNSESSNKLVADYVKFDETLNRVKNNLSTVAAESRTFANSLQVKTLDSQMEVWLKKNSRASKEFGGSINLLRGKLNQLFSSGKLTTAQLKQIEKEFYQVKQAATAMGKTGGSALSSFKSAFASIARYVGVSTIIYQIIRAFKDMYQQVYAVDTAMTELKKVTDETSASYDKFLKNASSAAKEIGTTIDGLVKSTADFARLGYSFGDAQELAKVANIYSVVGDEVESVDEASKSLISTMAAFGEEVTAIQVIDKLNEVGKVLLPNNTVMY